MNFQLQTHGTRRFVLFVYMFTYFYELYLFGIGKEMIIRSVSLNWSDICNIWFWLDDNTFLSFAKCMKTSEAAYSVEWFQHHPRIKHSLRLIMMMSQNVANRIGLIFVFSPELVVKVWHSRSWFLNRVLNLLLWPVSLFSSAAHQLLMRSTYRHARTAGLMDVNEFFFHIHTNCIGNYSAASRRALDFI